MCGIVGYCGPRPSREILLEGLKRLEYRGYDSAGICVGNNGELQVIKRKGKIKDLKEIVPKELHGNFGIGHTRWATHGEVNDLNAHPHTDEQGTLAIAHNGIIENYTVLKDKLEKKGRKFRSETDSEVIAYLIADCYKGDLDKAVKDAVLMLKGTYGIVCIHSKHPGKIVGAKIGRASCRERVCTTV